MIENVKLTPLGIIAAVHSACLAVEKGQLPVSAAADIIGQRLCKAVERLQWERDTMKDSLQRTELTLRHAYEKIEELQQELSTERALKSWESPPSCDECGDTLAPLIKAESGFLLCPTCAHEVEQELAGGRCRCVQPINSHRPVSECAGNPQYPGLSVEEINARISQENWESEQRALRHSIENFGRGW